MAKAASLTYSSFHRVSSIRRQPKGIALQQSRTLLITGLILLLALLILASLFYINTHVKFVKIGYQIDEALRQKQALIEKNKHLRLEVARLSSPLRIETIAKKNLGMVLAQSHHVIHLSRLNKYQPLGPQPVGKVALTSPRNENKKPKKVKTSSFKKIVKKNFLKTRTVKQVALRKAIPSMQLDPMP